MGYESNKGRHWVPLLIMAVIALCCSALFYAVPLNSADSAAPSVQNEMPWFTAEGGVLYFDESKYTGDSQLTVPEKLNGSAITALSEGCFQNCRTLTAVSLPESLEAIGEHAFRNCTSLRGIEIPESVVFIGKESFADCSALEAVCLSNNLQHIGTGTFDGCTGLRYVYFLGDFREWSALYPGNIDPRVVISCENGKFYQSGDGA